MSAHIESIFKSIVDGQSADVQTAVNAALQEGTSAADILNRGMISAMTEVGKLFEEGEYFVPEMLIASRAMQAGLAIIKPKLAEADIQPLGNVVIGTVKGDLHDIGKNLVTMMLEGAGFTVNDLGVDVPPEKFTEAVKSGSANIVALSALLTTTMPAMEDTIKALKEAGVRDSVKIIIGGAPVTEEYARQIGADGFSPDASRAAKLAKNLMTA